MEPSVSLKTVGVKMATGLGKTFVYGWFKTSVNLTQVQEPGPYYSFIACIAATSGHLVWSQALEAVNKLVETVQSPLQCSASSMAFAFDGQTKIFYSSVGKTTDKRILGFATFSENTFSRVKTQILIQNDSRRCEDASYISGSNFIYTPATGITWLYTMETYFVNPQGGGYAKGVAISDESVGVGYSNGDDVKLCRVDSSGQCSAILSNITLPTELDSDPSDNRFYVVGSLLTDRNNPETSRFALVETNWTSTRAIILLEGTGNAFGVAFADNYIAAVGYHRRQGVVKVLRKITELPQIRSMTTIRIAQETAAWLILPGVQFSGPVALQYCIASTPSNGILKHSLTDTVITSGQCTTSSNVTFVPEKYFFGTDSFSYYIIDGFGRQSNVAFVTLAVEHVNQRPTAIGSRYVGSLVEPIIIILTAEDEDNSNPRLTPSPLYFHLNSTPSLGSLETKSGQVLQGNDFGMMTEGDRIELSFVANKTGTTSFTWFAVDAEGLRSQPSAVIEIQIVEFAASNFSITTEEDSSITCDLSRSTAISSNYTFFVTSLPKHGALYQVASSELISAGERVTGFRIVYKPPDNFAGEDSFTYMVRDPLMVETSATLSIVVTPVDDMVMMQNERVVLFNGVNVSIPLEATDVDAVGDRLTAYCKKLEPARGRLQYLGGTVISTFDVDLKRKRNTGESNTTFKAEVTLTEDGLGGSFPFYTQISCSIPAFQGSTFNQSRQLITVKLQCATGTYNRVWAKRGPACGECPRGAFCSTSGDFIPVNLEGYYPDYTNEDEIAFLPCAVAEACLAQTETFSLAIKSMESRQICATGYEGVRCGQCSKEYHRNGLRCEPCPKLNLPNGIIALILVVLILFVLLVLNWIRKVDLGFLGIAIDFMQTMAILQSFQLRWPEEVNRIFQAFSFINLNIEIGSPECYVIPDENVAFEYKLYLSVLVPLIVLSVVLLVMIVLSLVSRIFKLFGWNPQFFGVVFWQDNQSPQEFSDITKSQANATNALPKMTGISGSKAGLVTDEKQLGQLTRRKSAVLTEVLPTNDDSLNSPTMPFSQHTVAPVYAASTSSVPAPSTMGVSMSSLIKENAKLTYDEWKTQNDNELYLIQKLGRHGEYDDKGANGSNTAFIALLANFVLFLKVHLPTWHQTHLACR